MKFAVVEFPGSNCDHDAYYAAKHVLGQQAEFIWHKDTDLRGADVVVLPGGFSYGDYLRTGAIARFSPIMKAVQAMAEAGKPVIGICNGFQMLQEAGLLPGAMLRNQSLTYICRYLYLRVERQDSPMTKTLGEGDVVRLPIGHADGNFYADDATLDALERDDRIVFRYVREDGELDDASNPNGAARAIAGITNEQGNVVGLMPHPDRCYEPALGTDDGRKLFESLVAWTKDHA